MGLFGDMAKAFKDGYNGVDDSQGDSTPTEPTAVEQSASVEGNAPSQTPKFCGSCGAPLQPGVKFCGNCGAPVAGVGAAPAKQDAVPVEPPHVMPTATFSAFFDGGCSDMSLINGACAFQEVTHTDPVLGTKDVESYFVLSGQKTSMKEYVKIIKQVSAQFFEDKLYICVEKLPEDGRQVIRIYSDDLGIRLQSLAYYTIVREDVSDGSVFYRYLTGEVPDILSKHPNDNDHDLTREEKKKLDKFSNRQDILQDFNGRVGVTLATAFGSVNQTALGY